MMTGTALTAAARVPLQSALRVSHQNDLRDLLVRNQLQCQKHSARSLGVPPRHMRVDHALIRTIADRQVFQALAFTAQPVPLT